MPSSPLRTLTGALAVLAGLVCGSLTSAPAARAATEFTFGVGVAPDIAVDGAGTAQVVWHDVSQSVGQQRVLYCQIPRGARGCTNGTVLYTGGPFSARPHLFLPGPGHVVAVLGSVQCGTAAFCTLVRESTNGNWEGVKVVAQGGLWADPSADAVYGPGDAASYVSSYSTKGVLFTHAPLGGGLVTLYANLAPDALDAAVGLYGSKPVVAYITTDGVLRWRAYDGAGDLNVASNWTLPQAIEPQSEHQVTLAGGPSGLFLLYERGAPGQEQWVVRRFTGGGWTAATAVSEVGDLRVGDLSQDASGRLHAVWIHNGLQPDHLRWRTSGDGVGWGQTLTINASEDMFDPLRVAAAADGQGFALWDSDVGTGASSELRAVPLEPFTFPQSQPQPPAQSDTKAPTLSGFAIGDSTLRPGQGTSFVFRSSESGRAVLTFYKAGRGLNLRRQGELRCLPMTRKRLRELRRALARKPAVARLTGRPRTRKLAKLIRRRRCSTYKRIGRIVEAVRRGRNEIVFTGRLAGRKLAPGGYLAVLVVTDGRGNVSRRDTISFRVVAPRKQKG